MASFSLIRRWLRPWRNLPLALGLLSSCTDVVSVTVPQGQAQLAVDGAITDQPGPYTVTLSQTGAYFDTSALPPVTGAVVQLSGSDGTSEVLREQTPGTYATRTLQGKIGTSYVLDIKAAGEEYQAATEIRRSPPVDSVTVVYRDKVQDGADTTGYYLVYHGPELPGRGDYLRFKRYKNGRLSNKPSNLTISSDELVDGKYLNIEFGNPTLQRGDRGTIEINSLPADYYHYLDELRTQTDNAGLFASPPANVRTNVQNVNSKSPKTAVGYFAGYTVRSGSVTVR